MLELSENRSRRRTRSRVGGIIASIVLSTFIVGGGAYTFALYAAPSYMAYLHPQTVSAENLPTPSNDGRVIIPKLGIDMPYSDTVTELTNGAGWLSDASTPPDTDGTTLIAAQRLDLKLTPQQTAAASPFYHLDQLARGDQIIIDYNGKRYGYTVTSTHTNQSKSLQSLTSATTPKLLLYTSDNRGSADGTTIIEASPLGEVTIETNLDQSATDL